MITLTNTGSAIKFTFDGNSMYLQDGTIEVPFNSLTLVTDNSGMATFKKSATNDIFISASYDELGMTKSQLETWFKENACSTGGGGGIPSGDVQTMIDQSISGFADNASYDSVSQEIKFYNGNTEVYSVDASDFVIDGMIDDVRIETISGVTYLVIDFNTASGKEDIQIPLTDIFDPSDYYTKTEVDQALSGKADSSAVYTKSEVDDAISAATDDMATQTWVGEQGYITGVDLSNYATNDYVSQSVSGKVDTTTYTAYTAATEAVLSGKASASDVATLSGEVSDMGEVTARALNDLQANKQDTLSAGTNITISGNVISATGGGGGGNPTVELTQAEYDALVSAGTVSADTYYIITDATAPTITSAVTSASTDSQIPTAKAVYDAIPTGGTGGSYSAGTNISIANDTISCTLPISVERNNIKLFAGGAVDSNCSYNIIFGENNNLSSMGTGNLPKYNAIFGHNNNAYFKSSSQGSFIAGGYNVAWLKPVSHITMFGYKNTVTNNYETAQGAWNNSVSGSSTFGNSGNTLFSVGNGTDDNARHNAFEIRQNGDIYCNNGTSDVKLQDYIQIKLQQITQADYDALVQAGTVDASTLYVVVNNS